MAAPPASFDAVIVGGGAAGLSLACHLAAGGWAAREVLVIDDAVVRPEQRAWAYWSRGDGLLDARAGAAYDCLWVRAPGWEARLPLAPYRYLSLTGRDLERAVVDHFAGAPGFRRVTGTVRAIAEDDDGARVAVENPGTPGLEEVRATWVFDSVGIEARPAPAVVPRLEFLGHRIRTDGDAFDAGAPTLMDFRTDATGGLAFVYVLPTSARTALVEHTRFTFPPVDGGRRVPDDGAARRSAEELLARYLGEQGIGEHRLLGVEEGTIPLVATAPPGPTAHVVPIGAHGGMIKASTGYGFGRIQRHAAAIAGSLGRRGHPFDVPVSRRRHRVLDAVLLDVVRDRPAQAVEAFVRLFGGNPLDRVLAFLDEETTLREEWALVRTLPQRPFVGAFVRSLWPGRWRR